MLAKATQASWMGDVTRFTIPVSFKVHVAGSNFCDVFQNFFVGRGGATSSHVTCLTIMACTLHRKKSAWDSAENCSVSF